MPSIRKTDFSSKQPLFLSDHGFTHMSIESDFPDHHLAIGDASRSKDHAQY